MPSDALSLEQVNAMRERPILFSGAMVEAILAGRKTQTRRLVKAPEISLDPLSIDYAVKACVSETDDGFGASFLTDRGCSRLVPCPYGKPGDRLRVVELRSIPGKPTYLLAGSDGHIYSSRAAKCNAKKELPFRLSEFTATNGYLAVANKRGEGPQQFHVHALVCAAFHGARPTPGAVVRHLDGNPLNNDPANLKWGTKGENEADKRRHKTLACGSRQGSAKLTEEAVDLIRQTVPIGLLTAERAAEFYGVLPSTIRAIVRGDSWRGIGDTEPAPPAAYEHVTIEIESISVSRLQDISEEDAKAEGCAGFDPDPRDQGGTIYAWKGRSSAPDPRAHFATLWDSLNGDRPGASWAANPWVWVVTFKRVEPARVTEDSEVAR